MNSIFKNIEVEIQTKFRRPPQVKSSKAQIQAKFHKIPVAAAFAGKGALKAVKLKKSGPDFSPQTGQERKAIPTACWSCVTRDSMTGYVENGRLVKLEGHPDSIRGLGKICSKGQTGANQLYDPDRILFPMKRVCEL
jgi:anaerobic selenocysteine-containing dehydrogenase